jgi:hypothetical protein
MHARVVGRIEVNCWRATAPAMGADGWVATARPVPGEGLLARRLATAKQGTLTLERSGDRTVARPALPGLALAKG